MSTFTLSTPYSGLFIAESICRNYYPRLSAYERVSVNGTCFPSFSDMYVRLGNGVSVQNHTQHCGTCDGRHPPPRVQVIPLSSTTHTRLGPSAHRCAARLDSYRKLIPQ